MATQAQSRLSVRHRALAIRVAAIAIILLGAGAALLPAGKSISSDLIGGLLIYADVLGLSWRSCFLINVPVGLAALALTRPLVPESRSDTAHKLDLGGVALSTVGLVLLLFPLVQGRQAGWPAWAGWSSVSWAACCTSCSASPSVR